MAWLDLESDISAEFEELAAGAAARAAHFDGRRIFRQGDRSADRAAWYQANRSHALAYAAAYSRAHRPEINERRRDHYAANRETICAEQRAMPAPQREAMNRWRRAHYRTNREAILAPQREAHRRGEGAATQAARAQAGAARVCAWPACSGPIRVPERGVIPEFCCRRCRDAAKRAELRHGARHG